MSIFENILRGADQSPFEVNIQSALVLSMLVAISADKRESREEILVLKQILCKSPIFRANSDTQDEQLIQKSKKYLNEKGALVLDEIVEVLPPRLRETAFAMCCEMIFADGIVDKDERLMAAEIAEKFQLDKKLAQSIAETFDILYRTAKLKT